MPGFVSPVQELDELAARGTGSVRKLIPSSVDKISPPHARRASEQTKLTMIDGDGTMEPTALAMLHCDAIKFTTRTMMAAIVTDAPEERESVIPAMICYEL